MVTGALAASYYGTPRTTMDIDVVVKGTQKDLQPQLLSVLKKAGLQVNKGKIDAAFISGFRIVTLKDRKTPFTLDIILSDKKLKKKAGTILGLPTFYQTPEELVLSKLRMIKATVPKERALKDEDDVKAILRFSKVNMKTLKRQARKDSTLSTLKSITAHTIS
jgi:hypothetical protein